MNKKELKFILQEGEGQFVEFKESFDSKNLSKEIVSFANASGGKIYLGIADNAKITGIKTTNKLKSQIQDIANNCDPPTIIVFEEFENILIIEIKEGENKPYACSAGFYMRVGPNSQKMKRDEILDFAITEGTIKFDEQINNEFNFKKDFDKEKLNNYLTLAKISKTISNEKILSDLNVGKKNKILKFNNAGILFFAEEPQKFISHSVFTCVLFKDKNGTDIIDRKEIGGNLIEIVEKTMKFVERNTSVAYKFTGKPQRENIYEYSLEAIREAVINSVMHRDYFEQGHNNILKIYPNKILITNVWLRPSWFKLGKNTFRRNKIIADLFLRVGFIEKVGTGFGRMENYCKEVNAPKFKFDIDEKYFRIEFFKSRDYLDLARKVANKNVFEKGVEKITQKTREKTREKAREKILFLIKKDKQITQMEIASKIGISVKGVEWNLKNMKQKGLIKRIGSDKGGYWEVENKIK